MKTINVLLATALLLLAPLANAGRIFVTGHDPIWHAGNGANSAGAINLATTGIQYARNGSSAKFLFVESITAAIPAGNTRTAPFLTSNLGYAAADFDVIDGAGLNALADFRVHLNQYSAIVVASDHGGMLTAAELSFLNTHSADIQDYINAGGGLFAEAQSNTRGLIGSTPRFGFLPFLVSSTDFNSPENANTVTAFGASLGLTNADVNGNFSHNFFSQTGGMSPVDLFNGDPARILSLAFDGQINDMGTVPGPSSWAVLVLALSALRLSRRRPL